MAGHKMLQINRANFDTLWAAGTEQNRTEQNRTDHGTDGMGNLCPQKTAPGTNPIEGVNDTPSRGQENRAVHSAAEASPPSSPHTG